MRSVTKSQAFSIRTPSPPNEPYEMALYIEICYAYSGGAGGGSQPKSSGFLEERVDAWHFQKGSVRWFANRGSPLRPFHMVLLCPLNIPKITTVHSLNLNIRKGLLSMVKQLIRQTFPCPAHAVIVLSVVLCDCCKPMNTCRD